MRAVNLTSAKGGINRLRTKGGAAAESLWDLHNGYVTAARTTRIRPGTVIDVQLPEGTKGLCAFNGGFVVFATEPKVIDDPRYTCEVIFHPLDPSLGIRQIHFAGPFLGYLYVVAEFGDGSVYHYWLQKRDAWKPNTFYREGDVVEPTSRNGLAYRAKRIGPANPVWAPDVERKVGDRVEPTTPNGYYYEVINTLAAGDDDAPDTGGGGSGDPGGSGDGSPLAISGTLAPAYVGVPYYNVGDLGDPWKVTGGDHVLRMKGTLPPGMTLEKGEQNRQVNVYGVPLQAGSFSVSISDDEGDGLSHSQTLVVNARPSFGVLDAVRRYGSEKVALTDAHTARFDTAGRIVGLVSATTGKLYSEVTITGNARIGVHAGSLDNLTISDDGNPPGTFGLLKPVGTYAIALDAGTGNVWISDASGVFDGDPAAGTSPDATLDLTHGDAYRVAINGQQGATTAANFGNSAFAYTPPTGFAGWALTASAVPAIWTSNGAYLGEVGTQNGAGVTYPPASEAGVLDYQRGAPTPGEFVGVRASFGKSAGKWQFEIEAAGDVPTLIVGLAKSDFDFTAKKAIGGEGAGDSIGIAHAVRDSSTGITWSEANTVFGGTRTTERIAQAKPAVYTFACDFDAHTVTVYRNGTVLKTIPGLPAGEWRPAMSGTWWPTAVLRSVGLVHSVPGYSNWTVTP